MKCFYHKSDLDGECSGAIIRYGYSECELIPIDYGQKLSIKRLVGETVFVVDFTFTPFDLMLELDTIADLVWIDHHKSAIEESKKRNFNPAGIRDIQFAACELTWKYYFPDETMPLSVKLLGRYDVWDHNWMDTYSWKGTSGVLLFQYGMKLLDTNPYSPIWDDLFKDDIKIIENIIKDGEIIYKYVQMNNTKYVHGFSFTTTFEGYTCLCCNRGSTNSKLFDTIWDEKQYDLMITFCRTKKHTWVVTIYTTHKSIDCSNIAKNYGGGGHKQVAGFHCKNLPFKI